MTVARFFADGFPLAVYRTWRWCAGVWLGFSTLAGVLMWYIATHPGAAAAFLTPAQIDGLVNSSFAGYYTRYRPQNFALHVWTNNAWLAAQCLAAGVLIVPVLYLLATNALNLGVVGGIMIGHGRSGLFFGLLAPHGLLELTAVFVAAGFGLRIGWAWIAPGRYRTRGRALAETAREGMVVALGLVPVLLVSGLLEAFVTPSGLPVEIRAGFGIAAEMGFLSYVVIRGSRAAAGLSADLDADLREADLPAA
jgi:uncharacterized membrane protein SpoIIM required for sporulation